MAVTIAIKNLIVLAGFTLRSSQVHGCPATTSATGTSTKDSTVVGVGCELCCSSRGLLGWLVGVGQAHVAVRAPQRARQVSLVDSLKSTLMIPMNAHVDAHVFLTWYE